MTLANLPQKFKEQFFAKWVACSLISDKQSVRYGIRFSYPVYLAIVIAGILLRSPYILLFTALIAFLGIKFPLHPFDYLYNYTFVKLMGVQKIPGRGSELQVNSFIALVFSLIVFALIVFRISINYEVLAFIYSLSSIYFIGIFLVKN